MQISEKSHGHKFEVIFEAAPNAFIMTDKDGIITLINEKTEQYFGYERDDLLGRSVDLLLPSRVRSIHLDQRSSFMSDPKPREMGCGRDLYGLHKDGTEFPVEIGLKPIRVDDEVVVLAAVIDITERKRIEAEREKLIDELKEALNRIDVLTGLLPICGACKKVRDDEGYWNDIEEFITRNSEAVFSHGICPDCKGKLYPELDD
jgi:PAS domain S-box-containing protein